MFSQASVCPRGRVCAMGFGVGMCMEVGTHPPPEIGSGGGGYSPPILTSSGGHRSGRYASYRNAFLNFPIIRTMRCNFEQKQTN